MGLRERQTDVHVCECSMSLSPFVQDVTVGDIIELEDSGIDGLIGDGGVCELPSRRYKALSVYSTPAGGSGDTPDSGVQVLQENHF